MSQVSISTQDGHKEWAKTWAWLFPSVFCSFETFFVLFLFAGIYKSDARFAFVGIDLTVLFVGLSGIAAIIVVLRDGFRLTEHRLSMLVAAAMFFGYIACSYTWTPGILYATKKTLSVCVITGWCFVACALIVSSSRERMRRFMVLMVALSTWLAYECCVAYVGGGGGQSLRALNHDYLGLGQTIGPAALIVIAYVAFRARSPMAKLVGFGLFSVFAMVMLFLGGRTPLCAVGVAIFVMCWMDFVAQKTNVLWRKNRGGTVKYIVGVSLAVWLLFFFFGYSRLPVTLTRLEKVYATGVDGFIGADAVSDTSRTGLFYGAVEMWREEPIFGGGIGSFPLFYFNKDVRGFPHNLILEAMAEYGVCGTALLGFLLFMSFRSLGSPRTIAKDPMRITILMVFAGAFCNAMFAGDMSDNRFMFAVLGLMAMGRYDWDSNEEDRSHHVVQSGDRHPHFSKRVQDTGSDRIRRCVDSATRS